LPANLTHQFHRAQERYRAASTPREQLDALQEMLREIPKHKGTDHLQADIKRKIKQAKDEVKAGKKRSGGPSYSIESGEYPQVAVVGPPNSGKSALIDALTGLKLVVAPYPFTTREPHPAMMPFENTRVQLVDLPPISADHMEPWISSIARAADAVLLVVDLEAGDLFETTEAVFDKLSSHKLFLGEVPEDQQAALGSAAKRTLIAANKCDFRDADVVVELFAEVYATQFPIITASAKTGEGLEDLRSAIWRLLELVRAVPKPPGQEPDYGDPILLPRGSTVLDMARHIHGDLAEHLKRARVWNCGDHADGAWIGRDHVVADGEIFELEG
jgi:small GTP-binding protein